MTAIERLFDRLLDLMAGLACVIVAAMFLAIVTDVVSRSTGLGGLPWVVAVCEYGLLYLTALGAPWLLRERGHVSMEVFRAMMSPRAAMIGERVVCGACMIACIISFMAGIPATIDSWNTLDERSVYMPRGILFLPVLIGFFLLAGQFARVLLGRGTVYAGLTFEQGGP